MTEVLHLSSLRIEELPVLAEMVARSLERDLADFSAYSPDFNAAYLEAFKAKISAVEELIHPKSMLAEQKVITERLYANIERLRDPLNRLEGYVKRTKDQLTMAVKDFGIVALRRILGKKDVEGLLDGLKVLLQNIEANLAALKSKGFTEEAFGLLENLSKEIKTDSLDQQSKINARRQLIADNAKTLNELFDQIRDVLQTGKILYKLSQPLRLEDYTLSKLRKNIRSERKKKPEVSNPTT